MTRIEIIFHGIVYYAIVGNGNYDPKDEKAVADGIAAVIDYINKHIIEDDIIGMMEKDPIGRFNACATDASNEVAKTCGYRILISWLTALDDTYDHYGRRIALVESIEHV